MKIDSEGLHPVANTNKKDLRADIVFVHGLVGCSHSTWIHSKKGAPQYFFWPEELGKDRPDCGIWTIGYPGGITALGKPGMIIAKRAGNLSEKLVNERLGERPLIFVTHSMGGLIIKSLIVGALMSPDEDRKCLVNAVSGIVFCATPHRGSGFADAASVLGQFFGGSQAHIKEMRANAEPLDILHDQFIEWHRLSQIPIQSFAENIGLFKTRRFMRPLPLGLVVPRTSANPGIAGHAVKDVDYDHITIVKPSSRKHDVYASVLRFVNGIINSYPASTGTSRKPSESLSHKTGGPIDIRLKILAELAVAETLNLKGLDIKELSNNLMLNENIVAISVMALMKEKCINSFQRLNDTTLYGIHKKGKEILEQNQQS